MCRWLARWLKRRALLRDAESLEAQARLLERSLLGDIASGFGPLVGATFGAAAILADHKIPALKGIAGVMTAPRGRWEQVESLRKRAQELRDQARR